MARLTGIYHKEIVIVIESFLDVQKKPFHLVSIPGLGRQVVPAKKVNLLSIDGHRIQHINRSTNRV